MAASNTSAKFLGKRIFPSFFSCTDGELYLRLLTKYGLRIKLILLSWYGRVNLMAPRYIKVQSSKNSAPLFSSARARKIDFQFGCTHTHTGVKENSPIPNVFQTIETSLFFTFQQKSQQACLSAARTVLSGCQGAREGLRRLIWTPKNRLLEILIHD